MIDNDGVTLPQIAFLAYGPPFFKIVILLPFSPGMEPIPEDMENESKTHCNKSIQWSIDE